MIVNDNKETVKIVSDILIERGYEALGCYYDGNNTLKKIKEIKPKVIILDYSLPDIEAILIKFTDIDSPKIIVVTDNSESNIERKEINKDMVFALLFKPLDIEALLEVVKKAIK